MELRTIPIDLITPHELLRKVVLLHPSAKEMDLIRKVGITKPLTLRPLQGTSSQHYQLLAGVSSWVAAPLIGLHEVPAVVLEDIDDDTARDIVIQIQEVVTSQNPIKKAHAIRAVLESNPDMSQLELAQTMGEKNYNLSHYLRLLRLPSAIQNMVGMEQLQYGHARALLSLESSQEQLALATETVKRKLSARVVERAVKKMVLMGLTAPEAVGEAIPEQISQSKNALQIDSVSQQQMADNGQTGVKSGLNEKDSNIEKLEQQLSDILGTAVEIEYLVNGSGSLKIVYDNLDILDGVIKRIEGQGSEYL